MATVWGAVATLLMWRVAMAMRGVVAMRGAVAMASLRVRSPWGVLLLIVPPVVVVVVGVVLLVPLGIVKVFVGGANEGGVLITPVAGVILPGLPLVVLAMRTLIMVVGGAGVVRGRGMMMSIGKPHPLVWQGSALVVVIAPRVLPRGGGPRLSVGCRRIFSVAGAIVVLVAGVLSLVVAVALTVAVVIVARRRPHVAVVVVATSATLSLVAAAGVVGVGGAYAGGGVAGVLLLQL